MGNLRALQVLGVRCTWSDKITFVVLLVMGILRRVDPVAGSVILGFCSILIMVVFLCLAKGARDYRGLN